MNSVPLREQLPASVNDRPIRRPGWKLIQDVKPQVRPVVPSATVSVEPVVSVRSIPRPVSPSKEESSLITEQPSGLSLKTTPGRTWHRRIIMWMYVHILLIAAPIVVIASIRLSAAPMLGELIIIIYGIIAIIRRIPSRVSFVLATIVLISIGIELLLVSGSDRANTVALFAFSLLCVGVVSSMLETRHMEAYDKVLRRR